MVIHCCTGGRAAGNETVLSAAGIPLAACSIESPAKAIVLRLLGRSAQEIPQWANDIDD